LSSANTVLRQAVLSGGRLLYSATGNPAASVPAGFTADGLPVGLQIVGRNKEDFSVLQIAHAFEKATNFGRKRPDIA